MELFLNNLIYFIHIKIVLIFCYYLLLLFPILKLQTNISQKMYCFIVYYQEHIVSQ